VGGVTCHPAPHESIHTLNHEEVEKALEEGIRFGEGLTPLAVNRCFRSRWPARSVRKTDPGGVLQPRARLCCLRAAFW
jgi:hypothetical protein